MGLASARHFRAGANLLREYTWTPVYAGMTQADFELKWVSFSLS